jgi:hypothetical protein
MCTNYNCANLTKWSLQNILISIFVRERRRAYDLEEGIIYSMNMATLMTVACYTCQERHTNHDLHILDNLWPIAFTTTNI